jgi:Family of unknown function (DUF6428)
MRIADMLVVANGEPLAPVPSGEVGLGALLGALAPHADKPLVFSYEGRPVRAGYHVTEVKAGRFEGLDCGASPEAWSEIFVQLWDVDEGKGRPHMAAGKFAAIVRKVAERVALDPGAKLTFEVSDGSAPMELHRAGAPEVAGGEVRVALSPRPASCKPRDRWLEEQARAAAAACCAPLSREPCCG